MLLFSFRDPRLLRSRTGGLVVAELDTAGHGAEQLRPADGHRDQRDAVQKQQTRHARCHHWCRHRLPERTTRVNS